MKLAFTIAWRLRQNHANAGLLSFISLSSVLGVGLGCFVLIVLLSVMNGFERELKSKVLSQIAHAELIAVDDVGIQQWQRHVSELQQQKTVFSAQPRIQVVGMLQRGRQHQAIEVQAWDVDYSDAFDHNLL